MRAGQGKVNWNFGQEDKSVVSMQGITDMCRVLRSGSRGSEIEESESFIFIFDRVCLVNRHQLQDDQCCNQLAEPSMQANLGTALGVASK
jgi:hypothetical protein